MTALRPLRIFFHALLWCCAVVLLGLTAYRVHYTKGLTNGDILTTRSHFYNPIIVELIVTSCLTILGSLAVIIAMAARRSKYGSKSSGGEGIYLFIIWVMFLVGAAVTTHEWRRLKWCRGGHKECRILETIKAFSWICFGLASFLILFCLAHFFMSDSSKTYNKEVYPQTRAAPAAVPVATAPPPAAPVGTTTETTYTEVRATNELPTVGHNV